MPPPFGFSTFLIRIGILFRMTCEARTVFQHDWIRAQDQWHAYLFHRERVHNFAAVVRQLSRLFRADDGYEACGGDLSWVCSEDTIDLLPDLQLRRVQTDGEESGE